jgi:hypothetical protein
MPQPINQPSDISNFKLKASYWYVSNKLKLKKLLVFALIFLNVALWGFAIYRGLVIFLVDEPNFKNDLAVLRTDLIDYSYWREAQKPQSLQILGFDSTDGREGKYDFTVKIKNPNSDYAARLVKLQLFSRDQIIDEKQVYILPNEEKYFTFFGKDTSEGSPEIRILNVIWKRVHKFEEFSVPRLKFEITDIEFKSSADSSLKGKLPVSTLNFKIKNNTGYSYWNVGVQMVLLSVQRVVGVNYLTLESFRSGETKEIEMRWYENLPSVSKFEIIPEVDILDPSSYMPVQ